MTAPPSVESPRIGVRRIIIDVEPDSPEQASLTKFDEVLLFGLVLRPEYICQAVGGRIVWELLALREAP